MRGTRFFRHQSSMPWCRPSRFPCMKRLPTRTSCPPRSLRGTVRHGLVPPSLGVAGHARDVLQRPVCCCVCYSDGRLISCSGREILSWKHRCADSSDEIVLDLIWLDIDTSLVDFLRVHTLEYVGCRGCVNSVFFAIVGHFDVALRCSSYAIDTMLAMLVFLAWPAPCNNVVQSSPQTKICP